MMSILQKLMQEISEDNIESTLTEEFLHKYNLWIEDGGATTINGFKKLPKEEQEFLLDYLNDLSVYERITVNNQNYILVHSLPDNLQNGNDLNYQIEEIIFGRPDFYSIVESGGYLYYWTYSYFQNSRSRIWKKYIEEII